ncbi:hypothetical protein ACQKP6_15500, partial [Pseudomonas fluorescens]
RRLRQLLQKLRCAHTPVAAAAGRVRLRSSRKLLASGKSVRFLVPDAVLAYIDAHGLYRASN